MNWYKNLMITAELLLGFILVTALAIVIAASLSPACARRAIQLFQN